MGKFISDKEMMAIEAKNPPAKRFISDEEMGSLEKEERGPITATDSALRGAAQGVTFGWADEIAGGTEALWDKAVKGDPTALKVLYENRRNESRNAFESAKEANPKSYLAGEVGGAVGSMLVPGMGIARGAGWLAKGATLAGQGALAGAGLSDKEDFSGDMALGAAIAPVAGLVGEKAIGAIANSSPVKGAIKNFGRIVGGVSGDASEAYLANPSAINGAKTLEEIVPEFNAAIKSYEGKLGDASENAYSKLRPESQLNADSLIADLEKLRPPTATGENAKIHSALDSAIEQIEGMLPKRESFRQETGRRAFQPWADDPARNLSETQLKPIISSFQKEGYSLSGDKVHASQGELKRKVSGVLNNAVKTKNPEYGKAMEPVAQLAGGLDDVNNQFSNRRDAESLNKLLTKFRTLKNKSELSDEARALSSLKDGSGVDIKQMLDDRAVADHFANTRANGSRRTLLGTVLGQGVGMATGHAEGGVLGAVAGAAADEYGGKATKALLDAYRSAKGLGRYVPDSAKKGASWMGGVGEDFSKAASKRSNSIIDGMSQPRLTPAYGEISEESERNPATTPTTLEQSQDDYVRKNGGAK